MSRIYDVTYTPEGEVLLTLGRRPPVRLGHRDAIHLASMLVEVVHHGENPVRRHPYGANTATRATTGATP